MKTQTPIDLSQFENSISYKFKNADTLRQALTHPSLKVELRTTDYERLEFLGDSVIGFLIAETIFKNYPDENEGKLAKRKAAIVSRDSLADIARSINLGEYMLLSHGEDASGGRLNPANLEDALEALVAAIYIDGGIEAAHKFVGKFFANTITNMKTPPKDPKSTLQEWVQTKSLELPKYELISMKGPSHQPEITVKLSISGYDEVVKTSSSKKEAERLAAEEMLTKIK